MHSRNVPRRCGSGGDRRAVASPGTVVGYEAELSKRREERRSPADQAFVTAPTGPSVDVAASGVPNPFDRP
jgi:hypothetical protein